MLIAPAYAVNLPTAIDRKEAVKIKATNGGIEFAAYGMKKRINTQYSAVVLQEGAESPGKPMEYKGRRYTFGILSNKTLRLVMILEHGELNHGENSFVISATANRAVFALGTDYMESRRVAYSYDLATARIRSKNELSPLRPTDIP